MNWIDLIIVLIIILGMISGWRSGLIVGILQLASWLGSLAIGLLFYPYAAGFLNRYLDGLEILIPPLSFLIVFFLATIILRQLVFLIMGKIPVRVHRNRANRALGIFPGLLHGLIVATILVVILLALPLSENMKTSLQQSRIADRLACTFDDIEKAFSPVFEEAVNRTLNNLTISPDADSHIQLPFEARNTRARPDLEAEMLQLLNQERAAHGVGPLVADEELLGVARMHSEDMFSRGYFSHNTPEGNDPFDRIREAGLRFMIAGENLALAQTVNLAHNGLMNSPGHRANILRGNFGRVGIGIIDGGRYGLMITQKFRK
jgi:uncharacterized protein YkwD